MPNKGSEQGSEGRQGSSITALNNDNANSTANLDQAGSDIKKNAKKTSSDEGGGAKAKSNLQVPRRNSIGSVFDTHAGTRLQGSRSIDVSGQGHLHEVASFAAAAFALNGLKPDEPDGALSWLGLI